MKQRKYNIDARYIFFICCVFGMFLYLVNGLANLQIRTTDEYGTRAEGRRTTKITLRGSRGMITDSEAVIFAHDQQIYNVTFYRDASQNGAEQYRTYTRAIIDAIDVIEKNGYALSVSFVIDRDPDTGEWRFNFGSGVSDAVLAERERQWRENNYLSEGSFPTAASAMTRLKSRYQMDDDIDETLMLKVMAVYSEMQMNLFNSQPIVIAKDVSYETVIEIETRSMLLPGFEIAVGTKRVYPRGSLAAQVIGYMGAIPSTAKYVELKEKGYLYSDAIGRDGVESAMEDWLTQNSASRSGYKIVERDRLGKVTRELDYVEPQDGNNVKLTLIASYQQQAERVLADNVISTRSEQEALLMNSKWLDSNKEDIMTREWDKFPLSLSERAAMMVIDMEGRVLACANYPTYDLNAMAAGGAASREIISDDRAILMNYNIQARGTPGSIFKMVVSLGALIEGELLVNETINDEGKYTEFNQDLSTAPKCWIAENQRHKHQNQTIVQGLKNSCNYFFYTLGSRLGETRLYKYASNFGLTSKTGMDLPGEVRSVVGTQNSLYDPNKPMDEASQDTSVPIIVFNSVKKHLRNCGSSRNIYYDDERLDKCVKRLMDMAVNTVQSEWVATMRPILMEELNMTREMVYLQAVIGDTYRYLNDIKWGGGQTILTAIGQSISVLTPAAVARYMAAVANGGKVYNLMLVDSITSPEGEILSQRSPSLFYEFQDEHLEEYIDLIHLGLKGVVDDTGTANKYFSGWKYIDNICAKTGTAEVTKIDLENNAWFICFAPYGEDKNGNKLEPEIAIAVFIPSGYSGAMSSKAARDFVEWYLDQKDLRTDDAVFPFGNSLAP